MAKRYSLAVLLILACTCVAGAGGLILGLTGFFAAPGGATPPPSTETAAAPPNRWEHYGVPASAGDVRPEGHVPDLMPYTTLHAPSGTNWTYPDDPSIAAMSSTITSVFRANEISFSGVSPQMQAGEPVLGFMPGEGYPMIFARDTAWMMDTLPCYCGDEWLRTPIEEFLRRQYGPATAGEGGYVPGDGAISAVLAPDGHIDKATAVSDEETSLIHAAYAYFQVRGTSWLSSTVDGQPVMARLNAAMDWLYAHRFSTGYGLIWRGHTTDWGDIKMEPTAGEPTDLDLSTDHLTASIYDQAMAYRALRELAEMNMAYGDQQRAGEWLDRAAGLRQAVDRYLWQPSRGFYRLHLHLSPLRHPFDEEGMVSIGSAVAAGSGLASPDQARAVFAQLERVRRLAGTSKPGLSLYPPYPQGTFGHPQMGVGKYQNGGMWDWWAGVQVAAEFEQGFSDLAIGHLQQITADWATHPGAIYEWQEVRSGIGWGPAHYSAAAGSVGHAIIGGLYGVTLDFREARLRVRLAQHPGSIQVAQPGTGLYATYDYDADAARLRLDYDTNHPGPLTIWLRLPEGQEAASVYIDGSPAPWALEQTGEDRFVRVSAPIGQHRLTVSLAGSLPG
jgi:hypothetical protein